MNRHHGLGIGATGGFDSGTVPVGEATGALGSAGASFGGAAGLALVPGAAFFNSSARRL